MPSLLMPIKWKSFTVILFSRSNVSIETMKTCWWSLEYITKFFLPTNWMRQFKFKNLSMTVPILSCLNYKFFAFGFKRSDKSFSNLTTGYCDNWSSGPGYCSYLTALLFFFLDFFFFYFDDICFMRSIAVPSWFEFSKLSCLSSLSSLG